MCRENVVLLNIPPRIQSFKKTDMKIANEMGERTLPFGNPLLGSLLLESEPNLKSALKCDGVRKGLQPPYNGPYAVLQRGDKLYKVNIEGKLVNISIDRLKPAFVAADSYITIPCGKDTGKSHMSLSYKTKSGRTVRFPSRV
ncbi:hypothetical protein AVEN_191336-1 [Araneus ventricosus]|uniref:Reverse transcriptase domain-containing protein n=1 Tax=Araneus ventricosus TaxID=182803 RepID=A0A4Y2WSM8_ARAVE|nr:hypothetical protein AVEN_191336-1 [Araneus ventricosus]